MKTNEETRISDISDYVRNNPGCSIQELVDGLKNKHSRVPLFTTLRKMEEVERIEILPNKKNRQTKSISFLEGQIINRVEADLDILQGALAEMMTGLNRLQRKIDFGDIYDMSNLVLEIISDMARAYIACALVKWPLETKNKKALASALGILFSRLLEIVSDFSRKYPVEEKAGIIEDIILGFIFPDVIKTKHNLSELTIKSRNSSIQGRVERLNSAIKKIIESERLEQKL